MSNKNQAFAKKCRPHFPMWPDILEFYFVTLPAGFPWIHRNQCVHFYWSSEFAYQRNQKKVIFIVVRAYESNLFAYAKISHTNNVFAFQNVPNLFNVKQRYRAASAIFINACVANKFWYAWIYNLTNDTRSSEVWKWEKRRKKAQQHMYTTALHDANATLPHHSPFHDWASEFFSFEIILCVTLGH